MSGLALLLAVSKLLKKWRSEGKTEFTTDEVLDAIRDHPAYKERGIWIGPSYTIYDWLEELEQEEILEKVSSYKYKFSSGNPQGRDK